MSRGKNNYKVDISVIRIIATLAVILLHVCNTLFNNLATFKVTEKQHLYLSSVTYLMSWAVPVFFMITGALFLNPNKNISYSNCISKYSKRMILALFIFGVPFSMLELLLETKSFYMEMISKAFINVFIGKSWGHLWYLYAIIGVYLVLPIIKAFVDKYGRNEIRYCLLILFFFNFIIPIINKVLDTQIAFEIPISSFAVFYVLLGAYIHEGEFKVLQKKQNIVILLLFSALLIVGVNIVTFPYGGAYLGSSSPLIVFVAILIFSLFKNINVRRREIVWKIDRLCFGVYLIHPVYINFVYKFLKVTPLSTGRLYPMAVLVFWLFFIIFSFITVVVMSKIPVLKKYIL